MRKFTSLLGLSPLAIALLAVAGCGGSAAETPADPAIEEDMGASAKSSPAAESASVALHSRAGFVEAGRMRSVGRKHGRWLDTLYMQLSLGAGDSALPEIES